MTRDSLGLLDCLLHVVTLLFSCVSREDGELMELDAVHEQNPGFHANALVGLAIHTKPWVLCVHLIHNSIPVCSCLTDNEAMEQLVSLLSHRDSNVFLGLEGFLEIVEFFLSCFFLGRGLVVGKLK